MDGKSSRTENQLKTNGFIGVKQGLPVDGVERMDNNAEITCYAIQDKRRVDPNLQAPLPAIGQTPARDSDKLRLAFRTEADTEGWRAGLLWQVSARDDIRHWGGDAMSLVLIYRDPHEKGEELCH